MRRAIVGLALVLSLAVAGRARAEELPIAIDRGAIHVRAARGLGDEAARLAARAEASLPKIEADLPDLPQPARIEIRLVHDTSDLASVAPPGRGAPPWAAGVAWPETGVLAVAMHRGGDANDVEKTLDHELAHLALGAAVPNAPRWLHEGFAWQHSADLDWDRAQTLAGMAWFGGVMPLADLEVGFPAEEMPASRAYAESYDFVGYLANRGRWVDRDDDGDRWPFRQFLAGLAHGLTPDDAAQRAFGAPLDELFAEWKADLVRRYLVVPAGVFASGLWLFAALLLVLAWWRRRRRDRARLATWGRDEAARDADRASRATYRPPPPIAWPGAADPFDEPNDPGDGTSLDELAARYPDAAVGDSDDDDGDDDRPEPPPRRWVN